VAGESPPITTHRRYNMAKTLKCRDLGVDCDFEARAETLEELMQIAADHARKDHFMKDLPQEILDRIPAKAHERVWNAIRDE
jgi:predicted small metal-binding protein